LNGYRPLTYIGFVIGTAYQHGLIKLMMSAFFNDESMGLPDYKLNIKLQNTVLTKLGDSRIITIMKKILIIEDDAHINKMLAELLSRNNYESVSAFSGTEALLLLSRETFSLILLDLMLPGKTGAEVLAEIRKSGVNTPVIALTALSDKESVVKTLKLGADDYITKPFDNAELLARIEVRIRNIRGNKEAAKTLKFKNIELDPERFDGFISGNALGLSKREFAILKLLIENPNKVFTKNNIYESVWGGEFLGDDNTVNVHISKIRAKIAKFREGEFIETVWGIGFKMKI